MLWRIKWTECNGRILWPAEKENAWEYDARQPNSLEWEIRKETSHWSVWGGQHWNHIRRSTCNRTPFSTRCCWIQSFWLTSSCFAFSFLILLIRIRLHPVSIKTSNFSKKRKWIASSWLEMSWIIFVLFKFSD